MSKKVTSENVFDLTSCQILELTLRVQKSYIMYLDASLHEYDDGVKHFSLAFIAQKIFAAFIAQKIFAKRLVLLKSNIFV